MPLYLDLLSEIPTSFQDSSILPIQLNHDKKSSILISSFSFTYSCHVNPIFHPFNTFNFVCSFIIFVMSLTSATCTFTNFLNSIQSSVLEVLFNSHFLYVQTTTLSCNCLSGRQSSSCVFFIEFIISVQLHSLFPSYKLSRNLLSKGNILNTISQYLSKNIHRFHFIGFIHQCRDTTHQSDVSP